MVRIRVFNNYGGKLTNEQRIEPGDYDADDAAIFGAAKYLVENGHAKVISGSFEEPKPKASKQEEPKKEEPKPEESDGKSDSVNTDKPAKNS